MTIQKLFIYVIIQVQLYVQVVWCMFDVNSNKLALCIRDRSVGYSVKGGNL